jgi:hypothetical protein
VPYVGRHDEARLPHRHQNSRLEPNRRRQGARHRRSHVGGFTGNVECVITEQSVLDTIVEWNKGQRVKVYGVISDVTMGDQCKIEAVRGETSADRYKSMGQ